MNNSYLEKPIFICGHRKTGTTMLINLFDGIDDAVIYPDDSGFFYMYYPKWESDEYSYQEKVDRLASRVISENLSEVVERTNCNDDEKTQLKSALTSFENLVRSNDKTFSTKELLTDFIEKYRFTFTPDITSPKAWIEKTTSTELYALEIAEWFLKAKFIHIIRDPRDNWASLKTGWEKRYKYFNDDINRLMHSLLERGKLGMEFAKYNEELLGKDRYKVVKYEELTSRPEKCMKGLAEFAGIEYSEKLLKPSTFGYSWEGNNFEGVKNSAPSSENVNRWKERITNEEAQLIEYYFKDIMKFWGYETEFSLKEQQIAALEHYKWYNFSTPYSVK